MPTNATSGPENGAPRSELQELQLKAGQVTDEVSKHDVPYVNVITVRIPHCP